MGSIIYDSKKTTRQVQRVEAIFVKQVNNYAFIYRTHVDISVLIV